MLLFGLVLLRGFAVGAGVYFGEQVRRGCRSAPGFRTFCGAFKVYACFRFESTRNAGFKVSDLW